MAEQTTRPATPGEPEKKGWLLKWTNYLKGYQRRWFVLSKGFLSYYRNQAEMSHTCRGTISLMGALIHTADSCTFVISNGGTQVFYIRASDEVERQSWVTALELAKAKAIRATESEDEEDTLTNNAGGQLVSEDDNVARELSARFNDLRTCSDLVIKHGAALHRSLTDLESPPLDVSKSKLVTERATLFRISCNAMLNACTDFMSTASSSSGKLSRALQHEREQKMRLQEVVEQLARQHENLENTVSGRKPQAGTGSNETDEEEEHEFFDAQDETGGNIARSEDSSLFIIKVPVNRQKKKHEAESSDDSEIETPTETQQVLFVKEDGKMGGPEALPAESGPAPSQSETTDGVLAVKPVEHKIYPHVTQVVSTINGRPRRQRVPDKPNYPLSLWNIMKNCIGKELSKIPIPVNFSEPLSMLQRLTEDYEYSQILDRAITVADPAHQLAYLAAFIISSYATTAQRTNKPFNPLLGETYECDRLDSLGWRCVSEQVSHHPPMLAQYCEGASGWRCWQEFTMTSKFRGKYVQINPMGGAQAYFTNSGNKYSWRKISTTVHNIIVGKLWVDNHGDMVIRGDEGPATGYTAHLKFIPYSYFSKDTQRKVTGVVKDPYGKPKFVVQGYWDDKVEIAAVTSTNADNSVVKTGKLAVVWQKVPPPPDSERWYSFTVLAAQLNEPEPDAAPTDSRHRPDQRLMEEGLWDEANAEKVRLEEKQRTKRRENEAAAEQAASHGQPPPPHHEPVWFTPQSQALSTPSDIYGSRSSDSSSHMSVTPRLRHVYNGQYWDCKARQDWSRCPHIF